MTNREWLNSLSNEKLAEKLHEKGKCGLCIWEYKECMDCANGITQWLDKKHIEPMPQIKEGDYILYEYSNVVYRAFCVYGNIVYLIDRGVCTNFGGEIKESTIVIKRYDNIKGTLEDIWRADDE